MFETLTLCADDGDAALASKLRRTLRSGDAPLLVDGELVRGFDDAEAALVWLGLLTTSQRLIALKAEGPIGQRGMALMLACDLAFVGAAATLDDSCRETPGLAALLLRRCGTARARRMLFGGIESLSEMQAAGLVQPLADLERLLDELGGVKLAALRRRKRALRAAQALPFEEALRFDFAFLARETAA